MKTKTRLYSIEIYDISNKLVKTLYVSLCEKYAFHDSDKNHCFFWDIAKIKGLIRDDNFITDMHFECGNIAFITDRNFLLTAKVQKI